MLCFRRPLLAMVFIGASLTGGSPILSAAAQGSGTDLLL